MTDSEKLDLILNEMSDIKSEVLDMKNEVSDMKNEVSDMKNEVSDIKNKVASIELLIENEIQPNIMRIAEGHLDLNRKLNESIKVANDVKNNLETYDLYIKHHESEISRLKKAE